MISYSPAADFRFYSLNTRLACCSAVMAQTLETEGSGVPFISDEEPGTSGRAVVTINPVALSKAGTAQHDIASDLERGWSLPAQKRTGIKIAFKVGADGPTFGPACR